MGSESLQFKRSHFFDNSELTASHLEVAANPYNRIEVICDGKAFFALREAWNTINELSIKGSVFSSWEWLYTWWKTYQNQGNRSLYILTCTNIHNETLGIAPFQIVHNPKRYFPCSRQLIMLGTGETDGSHVFGEYMDLLIKPGHETAVLSSLSSYLNSHKNLWDGIKFHELLADSQLSKLFNTQLNQIEKGIEKTVNEHGFRSYIELPETYKEYLMSLRKKMRNNITRTYSRLEAEQQFSIKEVTTDNAIQDQILGKPDAIEILAQLNRKRRGALNKNSVFEQANFERFHRRLLKRLLPQNKVSLRILHFQDKPVAALYSFVDKGTMHAYQSGFEPENGQRYSLLTTMLTQEISNSIEREDVSQFNFMYSDNEQTYKHRYSGITETMYRVSYDRRTLKYALYCLIHVKLKSWIKKRLNIE